MSATSTGASPVTAAQAGAASGSPLRLLTFTTLYPHGGLPNQGVFVENRLRQLVGTGQVTSTVLAPVPWFPSRHPRFGGWARFARAAHEETRHGFGCCIRATPSSRRWGWLRPPRHCMPRPRAPCCV